MKRKYETGVGEDRRMNVGFAVLCTAILLFTTLFVHATMNGVASDPVVYVDDDGECDKNSPCYTTVQDGLDNVDSGGTVNIYAGTYPAQNSIDKSVDIIGLDGSDNTIVGNPNGIGGQTFDITYGLTVSISDLQITGPWSGYRGIKCANDTNLFLTNNIFKDLYSGVYISDGYLFADSNDFNQTRVTYGYQPHGIFVYGGSTDSIIVNNTFKFKKWGLGIRIHETAIRLIANNTLIQDTEATIDLGDQSGNIGLSNMGLTTGYTVVRNNTITNGFWGVMSEGTNVTVENNTLTECGICIASQSYGKVPYPSNLTVANNSVTFLMYGLQVANEWSRMNATNNSITASVNRSGIGAMVQPGGSLDLGPNNTISSGLLGVKTYPKSFTNASENYFADNSEGFHSEGTDNVDHNDFYNNDEGIRVQGDNTRDISNNTIVGSSVRAGIWIYKSSNNAKIQCNEIKQGYRGIWITETSSGNNLRWNDIYDNDIGIHFEPTDVGSPSSNIVESNNITTNDYGILVYDSNGNTLNDNNISSNRNSGIYLDSVESATITNSNISNNFMGVVLTGEFESAPSVSINNNSILGNALWAINSSAETEITATYNFFGAWSNGTIDELLLGSISFYPWLGTRESNVDIVNFLWITFMDSPYYVEKGMIVNGTLLVDPDVQVIFNNSLGQNFIQVRMMANLGNPAANPLLRTTFSSNYGNFTIIYLNSSMGAVSRSDFVGQMGLSIQSNSIQVEYSTFTNGTAGVIINQGENNVITDSEMLRNRFYGAHLYSSEWNNFIRNDITQNEDFGVRFDLSENNSMIDRSVSSSQISCIYLNSSNFNYFSSLNIRSCGNGLHIDSSLNNTFNDNDISANDYAAQIVSGSFNTTIQHSHISNNFVGIAVNDSYPSHINNNSVLGNVFYAISAPSIQSPNQLDAEYNYFGTNNANQIAGAVTSRVDYTPWLAYRESNVDYISSYVQWTADQTRQKGVIVNDTGCLNISGTLGSPVTITFDNSLGQNFIQVNNATNANISLLSGANESFTLLYLNSTDGVIRNSNISELTGVGIQSSKPIVSPNQGIIIRNSTIHQGSYGVVLHGASNTLIEESTFTSNERWGLYIHSSDAVEIGSDNNVSYHTRGIVVEESEWVNITGNMFYYNTISALSFEEYWPSEVLWSSREYAEYNNATNDTYVGNNIGVYLGNVSRLNNITESNFTGNTDGVYIVGASADGKHRVSSNEFFENENGVHIKDSICNNISKNAFTANSVGAYVEDSKLPSCPSAGYTNIVANNSIMNLNEGEKGIYLASTEGNFLHNNTVNSTFGGVLDTDTWGILLQASSSNILSWNTLLSNEHGIRLDDSGDNNLTFNNMTNNFYNFGVTGDDIEHFPQEINTSNLVNNTPIYYLVGKNDVNITSVAGYVGLVNCQRINVTSQSMKNNYQGILIVNTTESLVEDIRVNWTYIALQAWFSDNNTIRGNASEWNNYFGHSMHGIYIYSGNNNTIENSTVKYHTSRGIWILGAAGNDSEWNNLSYVYVSDGPWNSYGILLEYSNHSKVSNSTILRCMYGIHVFRESYYNLIEFSNSSQNGYVGIYFHTKAKYNYVWNNSITSNTWKGLRVAYTGRYNTIYHNNFIGNGMNAEGILENDWDDGYPSGGNYWSDYDGIDEKSGPDQDQPGSDGIGDSPYDIPGGWNNEDRYPLMSLADVGPR